MLYIAKAAQITGPPTSIGTIGDIVTNVLPIIYAVVGVALFGYFVYGGFKWLMSAGDPDKVRDATNTMLNAVIGTAIVIFAYLATRIVSGILGFQLI